MDVHAITATRPEAVVRDANAEEAQERPREAEAHEADLPAVRVTGENEIALAFGQMTERARIVEKDDPGDARLTRMCGADAREMLLTVTPHEVHTDDLHRPGVRRDLVRFVHEEVNLVGCERARDRLRRFVIVIAEAREHFARNRSERFERAP